MNKKSILITSNMTEDDIDLELLNYINEDVEIVLEYTEKGKKLAEHFSKIYKLPLKLKETP